MKSFHPLPLPCKETTNATEHSTSLPTPHSLVERISSEIEALLTRSGESVEASVLDQAQQLLDVVPLSQFRTVAPLLIRLCADVYKVGRSHYVVKIAKEVGRRANLLGDIHISRRIHNVLGAHYVDMFDFTSAMENFQTALSLAKEIGDPTVEAICFANVVTLLDEMGHYREAINLAKRVIALDSDSDVAKGLRVQCAKSGLFSAYRIHDQDSAQYFMEQGQRFRAFAFDDLQRALFDKNLALYLIDSGRAAEAQSRVIRSLGELDTKDNRIKVLLGISRLLCEWSLGSKDSARESLVKMYDTSKRTGLYHHLVLQALVKAFSDVGSGAEATQGLSFARELVEYTTSVKKAKFYRQLAAKRESRRDHVPDHSNSEIDPFATVKDWLVASEINGPADEAHQGGPVQLAKHQELTAIHEDMAKLRTVTIRRDIRTDAVDTAENWAIAAEFFDDETGQHCYRVGHLASMLARAIGMDETFCVQVEHAARLHDIGKIAVNELILLKPGPLDAAEMAAMRLHTEVGAQILAGSDDPVLKMATDVARHHHEWWNGAGYPTKLSGKDIPMSARVCAYADVYDALTHMRAYKKAWTHERALDEIVRLKGVQFDPDLLDPFVAVLDRYRADLDARAIPGFADMDSNALIASRKKLRETISAG